MTKELKVVSASWCSNCKTAKMMLDRNDVKYTVVDFDTQEEEFSKAGISRGIPVFVLYEDEKETNRWNKFDKKVLEEIKASLCK